MRSCLILVRHGHSVGNDVGLIQSRLDLPLTLQGEEEMGHAGELLRPIGLHIIYTSTLQRAWRSAEIIAAHAGGVPVYRTPTLDGKNYGLIQGMLLKEVQQRYGGEPTRQWTRSYNVAPPGGESLHDAERRFLPFYEQEIVPRLWRGENVAIVAHRGILRTLARKIESLDDVQYEQLDVRNGTPRVYDFELCLQLRNVAELPHNGEGE